MSLHLLNVKHNDIVDYPLFLLKGVLACSSGCHPIITTVNKCTVFRNSSKLAIEVPFKALIPIRIGENDIKISCSHAAYYLTIKRAPPNDNRSYIRCIYVVFDSHEGSFQAPKDVPFGIESACHRLGLAARLLQTLTAETIYSETGHRRTFIFAGDLPSSHYLPRTSASYSSAAVWCVKSKLNYLEAQRLPPIELWEHIGRELDGLFPEDRNKAKWLTVISCTEYRPLVGVETIPLSHEEAISRTKGYCALGAGGLALLGSGTLYTWPEKIEDLEFCLTNAQKVDRRKFLDDSALRFTYWANYTTALGTMLHELGHCFDLDHTPRGIMRRGGDDLNLVLAFPPPINGSPLCLKGVTTNLRGLSIFRYKEVTFYENALTDCRDASVTRWGNSATIDDVGEAFWGTEIAQFLSVHRWFDGSISSTCSCKTSFNKGVLCSSCGVQIIQLRNYGNTCSPNNVKVWNSTASIKLPLDTTLLQGCVIYHRILQRPQKQITISSILKRAFRQLKTSKIKVVSVNFRGEVFQEIVNKNEF
ncbi:unnamed protein product [Rodentolepis nana]|uniref:Zinc metalloproteinase YIL108W n=1 Tax=Rodentolepis nana TaxID=102285 RepID=A0A0R3TN39_RODNA|nr:unnamed protein product [Rodentolepis nana]